ncbi:MAG TPA: ROK family protein [Terriglobales bacterium]|nr:ROK family protein [Terriglobales bacterium]
MTDAAHSDDLVIGVDIGGTKVAAGLVDAAGKIIRQVRHPMISDGDAAQGFEAVQNAIDALLAADLKKALHGIGICSPGPLDPTAGVVINPPNLPCWRNFPLAHEAGRVYGLPVKLDNDANAAGLTEALWGAGAGHRNVFYATIGTGIGTGLIFDGALYHGRTGAAGEGGHMSIDYRGPQCGCGKHGCIETLASGPAIGKRAQEKLATGGGRDSVLWEMSGGKLQTVSSEMVGRADAAGDRLAREVLSETISLLSVWLGNIIDLLEPDVIIVGGGGAAMLKPFFPEIQEKTSRSCVNSRALEIPLLPACYGADSGIAGGAALCAPSSLVWN